MLLKSMTLTFMSAILPSSVLICKFQTLSIADLGNVDVSKRELRSTRSFVRGSKAVHFSLYHHTQCNQRSLMRFVWTQAIVFRSLHCHRSIADRYHKLDSTEHSIATAGSNTAKIVKQRLYQVIFLEHLRYEATSMIHSDCTVAPLAKHRATWSSGLVPKQNSSSSKPLVLPERCRAG